MYCEHEQVQGLWQLRWCYSGLGYRDNKSKSFLPGWFHLDIDPTAGCDLFLSKQS